MAEDIIPTGRGLESKSNEVFVKKVIDFGKDYIILEMSDGKRIKRSGGTVAWRQNNPGNIKFGDFAKNNGAIAAGWGNHSVFSTVNAGRNAQKALLFTPARGYNTLTLKEAMARYAPADDTGPGVPKGGNQPSEYANFVFKKTGVPTNTILKDLTPEQQDKMVDAMRIYEGFKVGVTTEV